jgi:hypothetical protein
MNEILRPTPAQMKRRIVVLVLAILSVTIAYGQMFVGIGQTPEQFAADGNGTLRVAGYAFAIWGVIYTGLLIYAVRQALPATGESRLINRMGWPSALAFASIGLWIVASAMDWEGGTVGLIFMALLAVVIPMAQESSTIRALSLKHRDRWTVVWPLALLGGWLTVASPVNLITVLTGNGDLPDILSPTVWAMVAIVAVGLVTLAMTAAIRTVAWSLPVAWGLAGAFAAEQERNAPLAMFALAAAIAVLVGTILLSLAFRRRVERPVHV